MHVFRWDLDKTYLHTEFGSMRGLIRTALEPASAKRNTPGSAALLRALQDHDPASRTTVISGSPKQMRRTLQEKLVLDGIRVHSLTLKDNLGNLRRGRLRAVWGQVGYKLPHLLAERVQHDPGDTETLFGDDAEVDAAVYAVYADAISGRIGPDQVRQVLDKGGAYADDVERAMSALARAPRADAVEDIFIRLDAGGPLHRFDPLGPRVTPVFSWMQAALVLWHRKRLSISGMTSVMTRCIDADALGDLAVAGLIQDAVRRGLVDEGLARRASEAVPVLQPISRQIHKSLDLLGPVDPRPLPRGPSDPIAFMDNRP